MSPNFFCGYLKALWVYQFVIQSFYTMQLLRIPSIVWLSWMMTTSLVYFVKIEWRSKMPHSDWPEWSSAEQMGEFRESFTFIDRKGIQLSVLTCPKPSAKTKKQQFLELRPDERDRAPLFISFDSFCPLTHQGIQTICSSYSFFVSTWPFYLYCAWNQDSKA